MELIELFESLLIWAEGKTWLLGCIFVGLFQMFVPRASGAVGRFDLTIYAPGVNPQIVYRTFPPEDCEVVEGCNEAGTRRLLRFDTEIRNVGTADLSLGQPEGNTNFVFAPCHGHYHFEDFAVYRLLDLNGNEVTRSRKMAFCLEDSQRWLDSANATRRYSCHTSQGIQRGWADVYGAEVPCQNLDITGLPGGDFILELTLDPKNLLHELNEGNNTVRVQVTLPSDCDAPANDSFAQAAVLSGSSAAARGNNGCATKEPGEPNHAGDNGGHSVWYRWTAPTSGSTEINTIGSDFDTVLAIYTGSTLNELSLVAQNDDIVTGVDPQSRVTFDAVAGTTYSITVDGLAGAQGSIALKINGASNDAFGSCETLTDLAGQISGHNIGASKEPHEPAHAGNIGGHSVWFCWTAPASGVVSFNTAGSSIDTLLAVYTGNDVQHLTEVASDNDSGDNLSSRVQFNATSGTTYHIAVDSFAGTEIGDFKLNWAAASQLQIRRVGGSLELTLTGAPGSYEILTSTGLANWTSLTTFTMQDSVYRYTNGMGRLSLRFFRAVRLP